MEVMRLVYALLYGPLCYPVGLLLSLLGFIIECIS